MAPVDKHPTFQIRHRRRSSSVADSSAADLAARRPRRLSTGSKRSPPTLLERLLEKPQLFVAAVCAVVFLIGTAISIHYDTSLQTSELHHVHNVAPLRTAYFARKHNFFNLVFVKRAWAWTVAIYLLHLATSPGAPKVPSSAASVGSCNPALHSLPHITPRRSRNQRLAALVLASLAWILFTAWCFGAGLGDRIIALSGGTCSVPLPPGVVDVGALEPLLPAGHTTMILHAPPHDPHVIGGAPRQMERIYLPLDPQYCANRVQLDTQTHPRLFALLAAAHEAHEEIHRALRLAPPRWSGGFDVSGHAFLLTLGAVILGAEIAPSWRRALAERRGLRGPDSSTGRGLKGVLHVISTVAGTTLIGLWIWMLLMTAVYFHETREKLAGLGLGLFAAALVNLSIPGHSSPVIEFKVRGAPRRPLPSEDDDDDQPPLSPVFIRSSPASSDDAPLSPSPVRASPIPTLRRLDAVALLEQEAVKGRGPRIVVDAIEERGEHLHQE